MSETLFYGSKNLVDIGNVGIGTTTPAYPLDVTGDINFTGTFLQNGIAYVGPTGVSGPSGATGVSGPSGSTGVSGPSGATGVSGPTGVSGATGRTGATGVSGPSGATGVSGPSGATGAIGPAPSGSAGNMVYLTSSGVSASTANLFISTSNNVGIRTTSPQTPLHVNAAVGGNGLTIGPDAPYVTGGSMFGLAIVNSGLTSGQGAVIQIGRAAADTMFITHVYTGSSASSYLAFAGYGYATTGSLCIRNDGNVGIGTASPACKLEVIGGPLKTFTGSDVARLILGPSPSAGNLDYCSLIESISAVASNYTSTLKIYTHGAASTASDPTLAMTINSSQQVGIGTASPIDKLDVRGGSICLGEYNTSSGSRYVGFGYNPGSGVRCIAGMEIENTTLGGSFSQKLHFRTHYYGVSEDRRMTISEAGNVGIGTASPGYKLDVSSGDASFNGVRVGQGAGSNSQNTAVGLTALNANSTGGQNTAVGWRAMIVTTTGSDNTGIGSGALFRLTTGGSNTALGTDSMTNITGSSYNTAIGRAALLNLTSGDNNTAIGGLAGASGTGVTNTTCIGYNTTTSTSNSVILGNGANVGIGTASPAYALDIGGFASSAQTLRIAATSSISSIRLMEANDTYGFSFQNINASRLGIFRHSASFAGSEIISISRDNPFVGIGTSSPSYPLHVGTSSAINANVRYFNFPATTLQTYNGPFTCSIYAISDIITSGSIVAVSDERVKVIEDPLSESYMDLVDKIQVHQYSWIDKIEKGERKKFGFFAQEVEKVVPDAVNQMTGVIPAIYRQANAFTETTITVTNHGITTEKKLEVVDPENGKTKIDIVRVIDADTLEVKFEKIPKDKLFVVGPEVDDLRNVNHDYLMAVSFGAVKELIEDNKSLRNQISCLTSRLDALVDKLK